MKFVYKTKNFEGATVGMSIVDNYGNYVGYIENIDIKKGVATVTICITNKPLIEKMNGGK